MKVVAIKGLCREANVAKIDVGPKGAVVSFRNDDFKNPGALIEFVDVHLITALDAIALAGVAPGDMEVAAAQLCLPARGPRRRRGPAIERARPPQGKELA